MDWLTYQFLSYFQEPDGLNASKKFTNPGAHCVGLDRGMPSVASFTHHTQFTRGMHSGGVEGGGWGWGSRLSHCAPLNSGKGLAGSPCTLSSALLVNSTPFSSPAESFLQIKSYKERGGVRCVCWWRRVPSAVAPSQLDSLKGSLDPSLKTTARMQALSLNSC